MNLVDKKTAIDNNKAVKSIKKYKLKKVYDVFLFSLNLINPYFWFKKIIVNPAINILLNKDINFSLEQSKLLFKYSSLSQTASGS